jgi:hypothetical protein
MEEFKDCSKLARSAFLSERSSWQRIDLYRYWKNCPCLRWGGTRAGAFSLKALSESICENLRPKSLFLLRPHPSPYSNLRYLRHFRHLSAFEAFKAFQAFRGF